MDAVLPVRRARPARQVRCRVRTGLRRLRREGRARRDQPEQDPACRGPVAQDAVHAVRNRPSLDHLQGCLQRAQPAAARGRGALQQPVHRNHAQHQRQRDRRLQSGLGQPAAASHGWRQWQAAGPRQAAQDHRHRHAHARQRDRHQLLRGEEGARFQPAPPPGGAGPDGLPGCALRPARALCQRCSRAVCRPVHGSHLLLRL